MKKTYINPSLEVVKLKNSVALLAGSETMTIGGTTSTVEGRSFDFDFDDEE